MPPPVPNLLTLRCTSRDSPNATGEKPHRPLCKHHTKLAPVTHTAHSAHYATVLPKANIAPRCNQASRF